MKKFEKFTTWLFNPFKYIAGWKALVIGVVFMMISGVLSFFTNVRFNGFTFISFSPSENIFLNMSDIFFFWIILCLFFCLLFFILRLKFRLIDLFGTFALASLPIIFLILTKFNFNIIGTIFRMLFSVWRVVLLYNAIKVTTGLNGKKLNLAVIFGLISIYLISTFSYSTFLQYQLMYFPTSQQRKANLVHQMHIKSKPILEVQENIGKTLVFAIDNDDYYTVLNYFCRNMRSTMNSEFIKSLWDILESTNGQFINVIETEAKIEEPYNVIYIKCQFEHQIKTLSFSFAKKNVVYGFDLMGS